MELDQFQFSLTEIILTESHFSRNLNLVDVELQKFQHILNFNINQEFRDDNFFVTLSADFTLRTESDILFEAKVSYLGGFKKGSNVPDELLKSFCNVNAPAILFPYVREAISNTSLKCGLQPIIIQPINFVELSKGIK